MKGQKVRKVDEQLKICQEMVQVNSEWGGWGKGSEKIHKIIDPVKTKNSHSYTLTL